MKYISSIIAVMLLSTAVMAEDILDRKDQYVGVYVNMVESVGRDNGNHDVFGWGESEYTAMGGTFVYGYKLHQDEMVHLFGELRLGQTFWMEETENVSTTVYSVLLRPTYRVVPKIHAYALAGYSYATIDSFHLVHDYNNSGDGFALGFGLELDLTEKLSITSDALWSGVDIHSPLLGEPINISQFAIGVNYRF